MQDQIDKIAQAEQKRLGIPGFSLVVLKNEKVLKIAGYGFANTEVKAPATPETVYQLASVTKQFTATAVLMLLDEGKLGLEDPLSKHLPELPTAWNPITVRQLLTHTSGIKSYTSVEGFEKQVRHDFTHKELLALVADAPLEFTPGSKWDYSNTGYYLLGLLIEKVSGKSYAAFLAERIFRPLGMRSTRVNDLSVVIPGRATGYTKSGSELRNGEYVSPTQPYAAGALVSCVRDMALWYGAIGAGKLLKKATWQQAWTAAKLADGKATEYGFGWGVGELNGHRVLDHGGGIPGFSTHTLHFPQDRVSVVVLTNLEGADAGGIARKVAASIVPALAPKPVPGMVDPEPAVTTRLRGIVAGLAKGEVDRAALTPEFANFLTPERIQQGAQVLGGLGQLKELRLLKRVEENGQRQLEYRAVFSGGNLRLQVGLTKDNKIAGIGFRPD